jgi:hypothetical protein
MSHFDPDGDPDLESGAPDAPRDRALSSSRRRFLIAFFGVGSVAAGLGFCVKIYEFTDDLLAEEGIRFAGVHLLTYGLVALGFLTLLAFAFLSGHFADIEAPKYDLLRREREHDIRDYA